MQDLIAINIIHGGKWFEKSTMKFFDSKIESDVIHGQYFITSERYNKDVPRLYTIRKADENGSIETVGQFQQFKTKNQAIKHLNNHINKDK